MPSSPPDQTALTVRLDKDLHRRLKIASLARDCPASDIIRAALEQYLSAIESTDHYRQACAAFAKTGRKPKLKTLPKETFDV